MFIANDGVGADEAGPDMIDIELVSLELVSIAPVQVASAGFGFDVTGINFPPLDPYVVLFDDEVASGVTGAGGDLAESLIVPAVPSDGDHVINVISDSDAAGIEVLRAGTLPSALPAAGIGGLFVLGLIAVVGGIAALCALALKSSWPCCSCSQAGLDRSSPRPDLRAAAPRSPRIR